MTPPPALLDTDVLSAVLRRDAVALSQPRACSLQPPSSPALAQSTGVSRRAVLWSAEFLRKSAPRTMLPHGGLSGTRPDGGAS
jgi:hypothetical protein